MESTEPCPNCLNAVPVEATLCPHCGAALPGRAAGPTVWPPPSTMGPMPPGLGPTPHLLTKSVAGDVALGVVVTLASLFVAGLGVFVMPVLYFVLRPSAPVFARGIGYGLLAVSALLLGAFALCFYGFSHESH